MVSDALECVRRIQRELGGVYWWPPLVCYPDVSPELPGPEFQITRSLYSADVCQAPSLWCWLGPMGSPVRLRAYLTATTESEFRRGVSFPPTSDGLGPLRTDHLLLRQVVVRHFTPIPSGLTVFLCLHTSVPSLTQPPYTLLLIYIFVQRSVWEERDLFFARCRLISGG